MSIEHIREREKREMEDANGNVNRLIFNKCVCALKINKLKIN